MKSVISLSFRLSLSTLAKYKFKKPYIFKFQPPVLYASHIAPNWGSKKSHRKVKLHFGIDTMASDPTIEEKLAPFRRNVKEQGDYVRKLKSESVSDLELKEALFELKKRKKLLEDEERKLLPEFASFDRAKMDDLLKRRFFYDQSFAIYGGFAGQYDYGPMGCALQTNIINHWRQSFIKQEGMFELDCSILTPEPVLQASGHVERFADVMTKDVKTGDCYRLDHLVKGQLEKIVADKKTSADVKAECTQMLIKLDGMTKDEMFAIIKKFDMKSPHSGNELSEPVEFNLMFGTQIGPTGLLKGFLRPETAQGMFVNFKRLLEFNHGRLPFAAAQIGRAFRNEISPRSGLIRVREFTMAEIEHFCDPTNKQHPKFESLSSTKILLYSSDDQMEGKPAKYLDIGSAVKTGLVNNETLGYFLAKISQFLISVGIDRERLRFRQHMPNEMAHYATDCWDAECLTSYGWVECVGCADRAAFDLNQHSKATGIRLTAEKKLPKPQEVEIVQPDINKAAIGKEFKKESKSIVEFLSKFSTEDIVELEKRLKEDGVYNLKMGKVSYPLTSNHVTIKRSTQTVHVQEIVPNVIEPSFGVGRIMYAVFEHNFKIRDGDEQRTYFSFPPLVAPINCSVLPLSNNEEFQPVTHEIVNKLQTEGVSVKVDDSSGSIGRRYARTDEIAIPFGITIDFDTLKKNSVTLRERDSMKQVRIPVEEISQAVSDLSLNKKSWSEIEKFYPSFDQQESKVL